VTFPHVVFAAYMVGGAMVMGVGLWHLRRVNAATAVAETAGAAGESLRSEDGMWRKATRLGAVVTLVAGLAVAVTGDVQGKIMTEVQPMKMAAAEALYESSDSNAPFSIFTVGSLDGSEEKFSVTVPGLLSFLATGSFDGEVRGINDLKAEYAEKYADNPLTQSTSYVPNLPLSYWSFRLMMGVGFLAMAAAAAVLGATRGERVPTARWWHWLAVATPLLPVLGNSFG
jgi:cytochrome d ubiquinol oxidase subunit I